MTKDDKFFNKLYGKNYELVRNMCSRQLDRDEKETDDCVQEIFAETHNKLGILKNHENPDGWIVVTAKNYILKHKAMKKKIDDNVIAATISFEEMAETVNLKSNHDVVKQILDKESLESIDKSLNETLTEKEYRLYELQYVKDMSLDKISQIENVDKEILKVRAHRLKLKIRDILKKHPDCR